MGTKTKLLGFRCIVSALTFWVASIGMSASVEKINQKAKTATISEGKGDGIAKGDRICFFNSSGKRVSCGKVVKVLPKRAIVRVGKIRAVQVGMEARAPGAAGGGPGKAAKVAGGGKVHNTNIKGYYVFTPLTPAAYTKLAYLEAADRATARSSWEQAGVSTISVFGMAGEFEFGLSPSLSIAGGLRYRIYNEFTAQADYGTVQTQYVETNQTASAIGLYADGYYFSIPMGTSMAIKFGNGLDIDMSTQEFNAGYFDEADGSTKELASYTTKATVISLRNLAVFDLYLGGFGATAGMNLLLPLTASVSGSGDVSGMESEQTWTVNREEDIATGINHNKSGFGLELLLSGYYAF
ncbi:MAG: hypothetical protein AB7F87_08700 [Oligoflexales bacterium]